MSRDLGFRPRAGKVGPSTEIGGYRLLLCLGRGGMGEVWEAQQQRPHGRVALKLVLPGMLGPAMRRRFDLEAEVLGRLTHDGIARIYEAGIDPETDRPFCAMELIDGQRLDAWIIAHHPAQEQLLRVLIELCRAVQHAHQKGVIHRDLKPANILIVADADNGWQPKILDFGLARLTDADGARVTRQT